MDNDLILAIGELKGRVTSLEVTMAADRAQAAADRKEIRDQLALIVERLDERDTQEAQRIGMVKGGWWVLGFVATGLMAIGGALSQAIFKILWPGQQ